MNIYSPTISGSLTISGSIITTGGGLPLTGSLVSSGSFTSIGSSNLTGSVFITGSTGVNTLLRVGSPTSASLFISSSGNIGIGTTSSIYDLQIGSRVSISTATPDILSLGGTYSSAAGSNVKLRVYDDAAGGSVGGMSVSSGQMEINTWSSGKIAFYRSTTQSAIIDGSGRFGINVNAPSASLQVGNATSNAANRSTVAILSAASASAVLDVLALMNTASAANGNGTAINFHNAGNYAPTAKIEAVQDMVTASSLRFYTYEGTLTEKVRITSSGSVGIGTTAPTSLLEVQANQNAQTGIRVRNSTSGTGAQVEFGVYTNSGNGGFGKYSTGATPYKNIAAASTYVYNGTSGDIALLNDASSGNISFAAGGSSTAQMFISASGNVGIGLTSPSYTLHVNGTSYFANTASFQSTIDVGNANISWGYAGKGIYLSRAGLGPREALIGRDASTSWWVDIGGSSDWSGVTLAKSGGNVGIGTATPGQKLSVVQTGEVWASSFLNSNGTESIDVYLAYGNGGHGIAIDSTENDSKYIFKAMAGTGNNTGKGSVPIIYAQCDTKVGFFTTSPAGSVSSNLVHIDGSTAVLRVGRWFSTNDRDFIELQADSTNTKIVSPNETFSILNPANGNIDVISSTGGVRLTGGATSWSAISDIRQKDIIEPITDAISKVSTLSTVIYKFKDDETQQRRVGLIAQELNKVLPEAVNSFEDEEEIWSIRYTEVIPLLTKAIQELKAQNDALQTRIETLEQK